MCLGASLPKALRDHDAATHDIGAEATLFGVMLANRPGSLSPWAALSYGCGLKQGLGGSDDAAVGPTGEE